LTKYHYEKVSSLLPGNGSYILFHTKFSPADKSQETTGTEGQQGHRKKD
jgi:hypothetical protein